MSRAALLIVVVASAPAIAAGTALLGDRPLEGRAVSKTRSTAGVEAAFELESYTPGELARLVVEDPYRRLALQIFQAGPERVATKRDADMNGIPMTRERHVGGGAGRRALTIPVGDWRSGLYFARLRAPDGRIGFAPFVVAPPRLGMNRVAVVLPTLTWQAYNFRDDDEDGRGNSWYVDRELDTVQLGRAHLQRGVPYGYRFHLGFIRWLYMTRKPVDFLSQSDVERIASAAELVRSYDLVVFAGHHEYVTEREYDLVEGYRDLGGNLLFLSANNFFWRVERRGATIVKRGRWRDLGRPESSLVGVQYVAHRRAPRGPWVVRRSRAGSWLFAGTTLHVGSTFGRGGVEIDQVSRDSPTGVQVVAEIPDLFGPGIGAQMTVYKTRAGGYVLAAGAFHLTRAILRDPVIWRMMENVWTRLAP